MYPSYPKYKCVGDLAVRFAVPNKHIVNHILRHSEDEERLRYRAAGNVLFRRVDRLASLLSRHRIQIDEDTLDRNELGIIMFLPPPPCPPPKSTRFSPFKRTRPAASRLETIYEVEEDPEPNVPVWITLYEYLPSDKR